MITVTKIAQCYLSSREKSIYNLYIFVFNIALTYIKKEPPKCFGY